eukprot:4433727-Amphidinium_carterae.1
MAGRTSRACAVRLCVCEYAYVKPTVKARLGACWKDPWVEILTSRVLLGHVGTRLRFLRGLSSSRQALSLAGAKTWSSACGTLVRVELPTGARIPEQVLQPRFKLVTGVAMAWSASWLLKGCA